MYLTLVFVIALAWTLVELAASIKRRRLKPVLLSAHAEQLQRRHYPTGIVAGFLSCIFGAMGILTYGLLFAPLGAVCGSFALFHALGSRSFQGLALSTLGAALTMTAVVNSPSLWTAAHPYADEVIAAQAIATYVLTAIQAAIAK